MWGKGEAAAPACSEANTISEPTAERASDDMQDNISALLQPDRALSMWTSLADASRSRIPPDYCLRTTAIATL
jgi:hypothetical protein